MKSKNQYTILLLVIGLVVGLVLGLIIGIPQKKALGGILTGLLVGGAVGFGAGFLWDKMVNDKLMVGAMMINTINRDSSKTGKCTLILKGPDGPVEAYVDPSEVRNYLESEWVKVAEDGTVSHVFKPTAK